MKETAFHLAQVNIALLRYPLESPELGDFVAALDRINALADQSQGFVWRLVGEGNNATSVKAFEDERILVNLSVWQSVESLKSYAYHSDHTAFVRRRKEWFIPLERSPLALWWVPAGHQPTPHEARERLEHLWAHGPSEYAFTFAQPFTAPQPPHS